MSGRVSISLRRTGKKEEIMHCTVIMNAKGGVGKTVTTVNMAALLAQQYKKRVLVVDADGQGDASAFLGADTNESGLSALMQGYCNCYSEAIEPSNFPGVDILSGNSDLYTIDLEALKRGGNIGISTITDLRDNIIEDDSYDLMLIDCPPGFTACSVAALAAADSVIIPAKLDAFSVRGMTFLMEQIKQLRKVNGRCRLDGILVTQWHNADVIHQAEALLRKKGLPVFDARIRRTDKVDESTWAQQPLQIYSRHSSAGSDYRAFVAEWLENGGMSHGV